MSPAPDRPGPPTPAQDAQRDLWALAVLTLDLARRLLREQHVVRSLAWPIALAPVTLMLTVFAFVWVEGDWPVAVDARADQDVVQVLERAGFTVERVPDARQAVVSGGWRSGTDGHTLWAGAVRGRTLQIERALRVRAGASWMTPPPTVPPSSLGLGSQVMGVLGAAFALFGVVFGAGMVARDRDQGTLEAELSVGIGRWVHGAARWLAGTLVLGAHYALGALVLHAVMGLADPGRLARHGLATCAGAVAIGLLVIGRGGLKSGFSGPLATGLTLATGLVAFGLAAPSAGQWLPLASLLAGGTGWAPLGGGLALGGLAVAVFTLRSARA